MTDPAWKSIDCIACGEKAGDVCKDRHGRPYYQIHVSRKNGAPKFAQLPLEPTPEIIQYLDDRFNLDGAKEWYAKLLEIGGMKK